MFITEKYNSVRGERNYFAMQSIPTFTNIQIAQSGMVEMNEIIKEKISWNKISEL